MVKKPIIWSSRANSELRKVLNYFNNRNGSTAYSFKILEELEQLLYSISMNELIGRKTDNGKTRVLVMKVYLIFYEVKHDRIEILSFWDNRQDPATRKY